MNGRRNHACIRNFILALPALCLVVAAVPSAGEETPVYVFPTPATDEAPRHYVCYRAGETPVVDGHLDEPAWRAASWTEDFVDIEGDRRPAPRFRTRAAMLWDDGFFYVAAEMDEPDVWATLTDRDAVIFHDNDFEVFIDPDGDTHEYYELEVNALGTEWDLFLTKPYRDDGTAVDSWDIQGLRTGIAVEGTLNDPSDVDSGWNVELAIPWSVLAECAHGPSPPDDGDRWRVNFSRVEWRTEAADGVYVKSVHPETGEKLPEDNWVWSPQGLVNMHYPEMWGYVQFSEIGAGEAEIAFVPDPDHETRAALLALYYEQRTHFGNEGRFTDDPAQLGLEQGPDGVSWPPEIFVTPGMFEASVVRADGTTLSISHEGHIQ